MDRRILHAMCDAGGGPIGLDALSNVVFETSETIEDAHEPWLMKLGLVTRTGRGRVVTAKGWETVAKYAD